MCSRLFCGSIIPIERREWRLRGEPDGSLELSRFLNRGSFLYSIKHLIGIMFEYSKPCFLKNS